MRKCASSRANNQADACVMAGYDFNDVTPGVDRGWHVMERNGTDDTTWDQLTPPEHAGDGAQQYQAGTKFCADPLAVIRSSLTRTGPKTFEPARKLQTASDRSPR